jgi:hypothetical protein
LRPFGSDSRFFARSRARRLDEQLALRPGSAVRLAADHAMNPDAVHHDVYRIDPVAIRQTLKDNTVLGQLMARQQPLDVWTGELLKSAHRCSLKWNV